MSNAGLRCSGSSSHYYINERLTLSEPFTLQREGLFNGSELADGISIPLTKWRIDRDRTESLYHSLI
jgi:hypothetical protein